MNRLSSGPISRWDAAGPVSGRSPGAGFRATSRPSGPAAVRPPELRRRVASTAVAASDLLVAQHPAAQDATLPVRRATARRGARRFGRLAQRCQGAGAAGRVDFALCPRPDQPGVFIEVKRIGQTEGGDRQLFEYAFLRGVPQAVLTDGQQWDFYLPAEAGSLDERRVYRLDIVERTLAEAAERLTRYLAYDRVLSGEALRAARADVSDLTKSRQVLQALPKALDALISEPDQLLVELLQGKVADLCGYEPDLDTCSRYLSSVRMTPPASEPKTAEQRPPVTQPTSNGGSFSFVWDGVRVGCSSGREVLLEVLRRLARRDESFLRRFAARKHGRKRRYVAEERADLYPGRPDLVESHSVELVPGWWMGTNYSRRGIVEILELACEVAGLDLNSLGLSMGD